MNANLRRFLCLACLLGAGNGLAATKAQLERVKDETRELLGYATPYRIKITALATNLTLEQIHEWSLFEVQNQASGKPVPIRHATYGGTEQSVNPSTYKAALLYGDFHPSQAYRVIIRYPNRPAQFLETEPLADAPEGPGLARLATKLSDQAEISFMPLVGRETDGLGFQYSFKYHLRPEFWNQTFTEPPRSVDRRLDLSLVSDGEFSTEEQSEDFQNSLRAGLSLDYRYHPRRKLRLGPDDVREFTYPLGFRIKPAEFEANQDLDLIDYAAKVQFVAAVPYSDLPVLWLHAHTGVNRPFFPLLVASGYAYVDEVEDEARPDTDFSSHRWDSEILYAFPVILQLDFIGSWRTFMDLESGEFEHLLELTGKYYLNETRTLGLAVSYQKGSLPPVYQEGESVRLGFSMKFF